MSQPTITSADLAETADRYAARLAVPDRPAEDAPWAPQSLTTGAAGIALLHIERAHQGAGTWRQAHRWITTAVGRPISAADSAGLFLGAPAITFMLHAAATDSSGRYRAALAELDPHVVALAHRRVDAAIARRKAGALPTFREYDVFFGLAGLGALLLRRDPAGTAMERVLDALVALSKPLRVDDLVMPGWWVGHDPHRRWSAAYRGGHGNFGMAHGIAGPLAVLSQALRRGLTVDGHREAITRICEWLDAWRQDSETGAWWPEWITLDDVRRGRPTQSEPARPSWCYGTPGLARAGQLAGIATGDTLRQAGYEQALLRCLDDAAQQSRISDAGLCHGAAGVFQTAWRVAQDATTPAFADHPPRLAANLAHRAGTSTGSGFLDGAAGIGLALHTAVHNVAPMSGWDTCLLID